MTACTGSRRLARSLKVRGLAYSDLQGDGVPEILVATESDDVKDDVLTVFTISRRRELIEDFNQATSTKSGEAIGFGLSVDAVDLAGDGSEEIILGCKNKKVYALRGEDSIQWVFEAENPVYFVRGADLDGDGSSEVVALSKNYGSAKIFVLDGEGREKWSFDVPSGVYMPARDVVYVSDLDGDGKKEIIVAGMKGVTILDYSGSVIASILTDSLVSAIHAADVDGDGFLEVIAGAKPNIYLIGLDGTVVWKAPIDTTVQSIYSADLDSDGRQDVLVGATRFVWVFDEDGKKIVEWQYQDPGGGEESLKDVNTNSIYAHDFDGDGVMEVVAGFGLKEARLDKNFYFGSLVVFKVVEDEADLMKATTIEAAPKETTTVKTAETSTVIKGTGDAEDEKSGEDSSPLLVVVVLVFVVAAAAVILKVRKK